MKRYAAFAVIVSMMHAMPCGAAEDVKVDTGAPPVPPGELLTVDEAVAHLTSAVLAERELGVYQLGMLKAKSELPRVTEMLKDKDPNVQRAAVVAMRLMQDADAVPELERLAKTSRDPVLREQAFHEIEALKAVKALPVAVHAWKRDRTPEVKLAALEAMGAMRDAAAVPYLTKALKHKDARMRRSAAIGLGNAGKLAEPAVPALLARLEKDGDENVRVNAADALYKIGDARAVTPLLRALSDPADRVRVPAFEALNAWAAPGMEAYLAPFLERGRPHVRMYVAKLLLKIKGETALTLLKTRLSRETHQDVKPVLQDAVAALEHAS